MQGSLLHLEEVVGCNIRLGGRFSVWLGNRHQYGGGRGICLGWISRGERSSSVFVLWVEGCLRLSHAGIILETCTSLHTEYKAAVLGRQKDRLKGSAIHNLLALTC